jgi:hypothetical protein
MGTFTTRDGCEMYYENWGTGLPIVFIQLAYGRARVDEQFRTLDQFEIPKVSIGTILPAPRKSAGLGDCPLPCRPM